MNYITFSEIIDRLRLSMIYSDIKIQTDSLYRLSRDVHNNRDYLGPCSSFILESISLLADMLNNNRCVYARNEIIDTCERICSIIIHLKIR